MTRPWTLEESPLPVLPGAAQIRQLVTDEVDVVFQPIVDLDGGETWAVEAHARSPIAKYRNPMRLFEAAVRQKASGRLGNLLRKVTFEKASDAERVFVQVQPDELTERWLVRPDDPLCFHDGEVFLQITETAAFEHFDLCRSVLKEVCQRTGARLVLDDLGDGYSNLTRFLELSPEVVKLARVLVQDLDRDARKRGMVTHLVAMCHELGARVIADGIETIGELEAARDTGCDFGQGHVLAVPGYPVPTPDWPTGLSRR